MDSFYDVKGNEVSREEIVAGFINNYTGSLTDFNEGSEIRNLIEAFAVYAMSLEERLNDVLYVVDILNADGEYLDIMASQPRIDMERITGVEATGEVIFSVRNALVEELSLPAGTIVTAENGMDFETVTDNILLPGQLSMSCMVRAIDVGVDGNIPANTIVTKIDGYDAVEGFSVYNPDPFRGGVDYEEDNAFRDRIVAHMSLQKFGSKPYYVATVRSEFQEAHDILFDTSSSGYTAVVTPNTYEGDTAQAKLESEIMSYLSDDNNKLLGHSFNVVSPSPMAIDIYFQDTVGSSTGIYIKLADYTTDTVDKAEEVIDKYFGGGSLSFNPLDLRGLNLTEEWSESELLTAFAVLGDKFVSLSEKNDAHTFTTGKNKYSWTYHTPS